MITGAKEHARELAPAEQIPFICKKDEERGVQHKQCKNLVKAF
jgi:hypothetical protein